MAFGAATAWRPAARWRGAVLRAHAHAHARGLRRGSSSATPPTPTSTTTAARLRGALPYLAAGFAGGALGSAVGIGGGVLMIPLLVRTMPQHVAHGTSLLAVSMTSISATAVTVAARPIDWAAAGLVMVGAVLGVRLGANTTARLAPKRLSRVFGAALMVLGPMVPLGHMVTHRDLPPPAQEAEDKPARDPDELALPDHEGTLSDPGSLFAGDAGELMAKAVTVPVGCVAGFLSGLLGVGGGTIVTPALSLTDPSQSQKDIIAISLAAMVVPSLIGTLRHHTLGNVRVRAGVPLGIGAILGAAIGSRSAMKARDEELRWLLAAALFLSGLKSLIAA